MMNKTTSLIFLSSLVLSFAIFGNGIRGNFVYDDTFAIQERYDLKDPRNLFSLFVSPYYFQQPEIGLYRPLPMVTYLLNFSLFGESPISFKVVNILLHAMASFLVFKLIQFLTASFRLSLVSFLLFLVHPIHTEAVTLVVGRAELLSTLLSVVTIYLFLSGRILRASFAFLLALLSKETALATLPMMAYIQWSRERSLRDFMAIKNLKAYLFLLAAIACYLFLRFLALGKFIFYARATDFVENPLPFIPIPERMFTAFKVLYLYVEKLIVPIELSNDYSVNVIKIVQNPLTSWQSLLGMLSFVLLIVLCLHPKTKKTPLGLGAIIFVLPYLLVSNFIAPTGTIMGERLMYFSSIGFAVILVFLIDWMRSKAHIRPGVVNGTVGIILVLYGARTIARNEDWLSNDNLYKVNLNNHPEGFLTQLYWGTALINRGQMEEGKIHLRAAEKIYPENPKLITTLGALAELEGNDSLAEESYKKAISKYELAIEAYSKLAYLYFNQERYEEAEENFLKAMKLYPNPSDASYYARTQIQLKTPEKGIEAIHKYFGDNPGDIELVTALGYSYYLEEDYENALQYLTRSKNLGNTNPEIDNMIGVSEAMLENKPQGSQ